MVTRYGLRIKPGGGGSGGSNGRTTEPLGSKTGQERCLPNKTIGQSGIFFKISKRVKGDQLGRVVMCYSHGEKKVLMSKVTPIV